MFFSHLRRVVLWSCTALATALAAHAQAGIVLNTTRVIYPATDKEMSFQVHNTGTGEILAQSWLETDSEGPSVNSPLFAITPSLARLPGNARQLIRIIYSGDGLATDRESVLWLNVQEIPQTARENELQIAVRQRIKLFYRPQGLVEDPLKAAQSLRWQLSDGHLEVTNPGPYHVSMIKLAVARQGQIALKEDSRMLAPGARVQLPLKPMKQSGPVDLTFISINDFGAQEPYRAKVSDEQAVEAGRADPRPD